MIALCELCWAQVSVDEIEAHLREQHDLEVEIMRWADGRPVIVDKTLEPEDFAA